ncbi:MAG: cmk [Schlesneria sp.]|nr:cmk [Schlesneria sp.]
MIVTIDGPAGTGKSSVAKTLAERLGFEFLNTGAMYRAVAYACLDKRIDVDDRRAAAETMANLEIRFANNRLLLAGDDVTDQLHRRDVTSVVSFVPQNPEVRSRLVGLQRGVGRRVNLVTEGRDQGTIVFPDAEFKFFLTATKEERARRRQRQLHDLGNMVSIWDLIDQQEVRDRRHEARACAPLRPAQDAQIIDTTEMSLSAVVDLLDEQVAAGRREFGACQYH